MKTGKWLFMLRIITILVSVRIGQTCTIAVIGSGATLDGRPLLWKNRDVGSMDQQFNYFPPTIRNGRQLHGYIGNYYRSDTSRIYMGANDAGFAIINSNTYNLNDSLTTGIDDGTLMRLALETCTKLAEFEFLLDSTNATGRGDCWNFGVCDTYGRAAIYECGNRHWQPFYANAINGQVLVRANYSLSGGDTPRFGEIRYKRAAQLLGDPPKSLGITPAFLLANLARDMANEYDNPHPLPYSRSQNGAPGGYIFVRNTISNSYTTSAVVIRGTALGENPELIQIYAMLGLPAMSLAYPLWIGAHYVPVFLNSDTIAPMADIIARRLPLFYDIDNYYSCGNSRYLLSENGGGLYSITYPLERYAIETADSCQSAWQLSPPSSLDISLAQLRIANRLFYGFMRGSTFGIDRR